MRISSTTDPKKLHQVYLELTGKAPLRLILGRPRIKPQASVQAK